jgi:hypothetical protein
LLENIDLIDNSSNQLDANRQVEQKIEFSYENTPASKIERLNKINSDIKNEWHRREKELKSYYENFYENKLRELDAQWRNEVEALKSELKTKNDSNEQLLRESENIKSKFNSENQQRHMNTPPKTPQQDSRHRQEIEMIETYSQSKENDFILEILFYFI